MITSPLEIQIKQNTFNITKWLLGPNCVLGRMYTATRIMYPGTECQMFVQLRASFTFIVTTVVQVNSNLHARAS